MKTTNPFRTLSTLAALALATLAPASAAIGVVNHVKGYPDTTKTKIATTNLGTTLLSYDATGVSKLVVAIGFESGFNNNSATVLGVTFNGIALTQAVQENSFLNTSWDGGTAAIFYLDNPYQGAATFTISLATSGGGPNGGLVSIIGLSGTAGGNGATGKSWATQASAGNVSTSITTSVNDSLVIAMVENSGRNSSAGTPTVVSPLTLLDNGYWGTQYGSIASGYQSVAGVGTAITPTFNTAAGGNIHVVAVEFKSPVPTQYWDVNGILAGAGGVNGDDPAGTWDASTNLYWNASSDGIGTGTVAWSQGSTAVFAAGTTATGAYDVDVDGTQDITGLIFEEGTVTLANGVSGALRLTGATPANVVPGLTATVAIPVGEDTTGRELIKVGAGTLVVSGDLSHTGATSVAAGTLILSGNNVAATGGMTLNGGFTQFNSLASINGTGNNVTVNAGGTVVFGSSFGTATDITTALASRIVASSVGTIAADNQDTTAFDFNTPGLTAAYLGAVGNVSYTGTPLTPNGTTYRLGGGGGTLTMANANTVTGTGNSLIVKGKVTLAAANNYDSGTTLTAGVLTLGDDNSIGAGPLTLNGGTIDASSARTLATNNAVTIGGNFTFGGSNALNLGTGAVTNAGNRTITLSGTSSTLTMGGVMTNTSNAVQTTTVAGAGNTLVLGGYALSDSATNRIDVINGSGNVTISGAVTNGGTATASGLTYSGTGVLTLSGSSSYTGVTTVSAGTLAIPSVADAGNNSPLGAYATAGASGISLGAGTLKYTGVASGATNRGFTITGNANIDVPGGLTLTFGACTLASGNVTAVSSTGGGSGTMILGNVTLTAAKNINTTTGKAECNNFSMGTFSTIFDTSSGTAVNGVTIKGILSGSGTVTKTGGSAGYLRLFGPNTYTGATVLLRGFLNVSSLNNLGSGGLTPLTSSSLGIPTTVATGTIKIGNAANTTPAATLVYTGSGETTDRVIDLAGTTAGAVLDQSGANLLKFTSYTGTTNAFTATGVGIKTLTLQGSNPAGTGEIAAAIVDNSTTNKTSLTKSGTGTWTLSGTNSYTGATTVSNGTLLINSPGSLNAGSAVAVNGGTLGGTGVIGGSVTVAAGGSLAPGTSAGTLSITGGLNISAPANGGAGKLKFELDALANTSDKIAVTGTLTIGNGVLGFGDFVFTNLGGLQVGTYKLITSGGISGTLDSAANLSGATGTLTGTLRITGNDLELVVTTPTPYETWAYGTFANAFTDQYPSHNPDGDSLTNLQEYAFGTDPTVSSSGSIIYVPGGDVTTPGLPVAANFAVGAGVDFRAVFGRRKDYVAAGLTYTVQFSAGLDVWVDNTATPTLVTGVSSSGAIDAVSVPYPLFIPTTNGVEKPTFFRVAVTSN